MTPLQPGSFRSETGDGAFEPDPYHSKSTTGQNEQSDAPVFDKVSVATPDSNLGKAAAAFIQKCGSPSTVIYPAFGAHVIDEIFPGASILYIDPSESGIRTIREHVGGNVRALALSIEQYPTDEQFDLLFTLNSHAPMDLQVMRVKPGGYIFCNNYFGTNDAKSVMELGSCDLLNVIEVYADRVDVVHPAASDTAVFARKELTEEEYEDSRKVIQDRYYVFRKRPPTKL